VGSKSKGVCSCACAFILLFLGWQLDARAILIDFNNLSAGRTADGTYFDAQIRTLVTISDGVDGPILQSGSGRISSEYGSPGIFVPRMFLDPNIPPPENGIINRVLIDVGFSTRVSTFSVDVDSAYSSILFYTGFDAAGQSILGNVPFFSTHDWTYQHLEVAAPTGGYLTGFYFSQQDRGGVSVALDNLDYTRAAVPDTTTTISALAIAVGSLAFLRRRLKRHSATV
jgi:hypothetical protein